REFRFVICLQRPFHSLLSGRQPDERTLRGGFWFSGVGESSLWRISALVLEEPGPARSHWVRSVGRDSVEPRRVRLTAKRSVDPYSTESRSTSSDPSICLGMRARLESLSRHC